MKTIILVLTLLLSYQLTAKQRIYKWTDANGNVHYSENKPSNTKAKEIKVTTGKSKPKNTLNINEEDEPPVVSDNKSKDEQAFDEYNKREQERADKIRNIEGCKLAKKNLITLQNSARIRKKDPVTGEYMQMSNNQRNSALKSAKKLIRDVCK